MHFSIPDTEEFSDNGGSMYMGYNILINGAFHCTVRYRQLHSLHEQLRRILGPANLLLPPFPPKRLLPLSPNQLEERRAVLEKYIQTVSQDPRVATSDLFLGFLLSAQAETRKELCAEVELDIYLMNGQRVTLHVSSMAPTNDVLEHLCQEIHLPPELMNYFSLFLIKKEEDGDLSVIKRLQDFESPYISFKSLEGPHRIVLRKSFWDPGLETTLLGDRVALNLLYVQAVAEVERGWVLADRETQVLLSSLQSQGDKLQYLEVARGLKYYGFLHFKPCWCDYPRAGTRVLICAGNRELIFRVQLSSPDDSSCSGSSSSTSGDLVREGTFRVRRMRCWRITTLHNGEQSAVLAGRGSGPHLELAFQYLMATDRLQWITVCSEQAILLSVCLQSMVNELLMKKNGDFPGQTKEKTRTSSWSYMRRDGSSHQIASLSKSASSDILSTSSKNFVNTKSQNPNGSTKTKSSESQPSSIRKLSEKFSSVALKAGGKSSPSTPTPVPTNPFVENDAFDGIGDEDL